MAKILVVDDEPPIVQMVSSRLKSAGYDIVSAKNGEEALAVVRTEKPDLIVMDVMMPKLDGYQTCATLKQDERYRQIPVILLTAKAGDEAKQIGLDDCGADGYMTKPFDPQGLLGKVAELLK